jgi:hypothetical protein
MEATSQNLFNLYGTCKKISYKVSLATQNLQMSIVIKHCHFQLMFRNTFFLVRKKTIESLWKIFRKHLIFPSSL